MSRPKPLVLIILDGWGYRAETKANAIALARKPTYDRLLREYPNTLIHTSGPFVGLPEGQMGNSEVGHLNIGAGRIVHMDITRIDLMVRNGEFFQHPVLLDAMIVRMILVPGLMLVAGKANWALPRALDRLLPHLNVEGSVHHDEPDDTLSPQPVLVETAA